MASQDLPRPWMLAALTDMPVTMLSRRNATEPDAAEHDDAVPRPDPRRRRLSVRPFADHCSEQGQGEDCWGGAAQWQEVEVDRAA